MTSGQGQLACSYVSVGHVSVSAPATAHMCCAAEQQTCVLVVKIQARGVGSKWPFVDGSGQSVAVNFSK